MDFMESADSTSLVIDVIRELTNDTKYASFMATVSATVAGVDVIVGEPIEVALTYDGTNFANVSVIWENHGYKNYRRMGLFGVMNTRYQSVRRTADREFCVEDRNYSVTIGY